MTNDNDSFTADVTRLAVALYEAVANKGAFDALRDAPRAIAFNRGESRHLATLGVIADLINEATGDVDDDDAVPADERGRPVSIDDIRALIAAHAVVLAHTAFSRDEFIDEMEGFIDELAIR